MASALTVVAYNGHGVSAYVMTFEVVRGARSIGVILLDRRAPLIVPALFSRDVQPALDIRRFEHLILQKHLPAIPRP
jgi:hypothetical protein